MLNDAVPAPKAPAITNNKRTHNDNTRNVPSEKNFQPREFNYHPPANVPSAATTPQPTNNHNHDRMPPKGKAVSRQQ